MSGSLTVFGYSDLEGIYDDPERVARLTEYFAGELLEGCTTNCVDSVFEFVHVDRYRRSVRNPRPLRSVAAVNP